MSGSQIYIRIIFKSSNLGPLFLVLIRILQRVGSGSDPLHMGKHKGACVLQHTNCQLKDSWTRNKKPVNVRVSDEWRCKELGCSSGSGSPSLWNQRSGFGSVKKKLKKKQLSSHQKFEAKITPKILFLGEKLWTKYVNLMILFYITYNYYIICYFITIKMGQDFLDRQYLDII